MKRIKKWFVNLSIKRKFLYCVSGVTVFVVLTACLFFYFMAAGLMLEETKKQSIGTFSELALNIDHYFKLAENSFDYIANNDNVQEELKSDNPYRSDGTENLSYYSRAGQIRRLLIQGYTSVYMNDLELIGYNGANHIITNGNDIEIADEGKIIQLAEETSGRCIYYHSKDDESLIHIAKQIKDSLTMEPLGMLRASIKISYLEKMTEMVQKSLQANVILIDDKDEIVFNNSELDITPCLDRIIGSNGNFSMKIKGKQFCCVYIQCDSTKYKLVGMIPMKILTRTSRTLQLTAIILLGASFLFCMYLANKLARVIVEPIEQNGAAMEKFSKGDFSVRLPEGRTDELGTMNHIFNQTIEKIETLLKQVVEMELLNKDMEFKTLQAQINPHFLYNVLDTINWMARKKNEVVICKMVTAVSNLMRYSISYKKDVITIKEEMKYVQDYIFIQETRFKDKFITDINVAPELEEVQLPKMTIQTLVENAIVHGVENAPWECKLSLLIRQEKGMAYISIKDTGVGIKKEILDHLMEQSEPSMQAGRTHTNLGIYAVKQRLDYVYHGQFYMKIISEEGKGTEVILKIPIILEGANA